MRERSIVDVIEKIIDTIPSHLKEKHLRTGMQPLIDRLNRILYDISYTAPEDITRHWRSLAITLTDHLGKPDEKWKKKISRIIRGETK